MEIIVGKTAGFCPGVKRTIIEAEKLLDKVQPFSCLGDIVHNKQVIQKLVKKGLIIISDIEEAKENIMFRAHGVSKEKYNQAKEKGLTIYDLTCPKVLAIHKLAEQYEKEGAVIFYIAEKGHPETIGTESFCGKNYYTIETEQDLQKAIKKQKEAKDKKIVILSQTTFHKEKFESFCRIIQEELGKQKEIILHSTICDATRLRQKETKELAKKVEAMIVIGGKKSSNSNKLNEIAREYCKNVQFVETKGELVLNKLEGAKKIGVMAGASTPQESIEEIVALLEKVQ